MLTQTQLERLLADTPARTLRYRTERLTRLRLLGRSRPYRERGSAPFHYWPTRASDAFVRGEPVPRGGERSEPNPLFLHHAERLSELYVLLAVQAPTVGLRLQGFKREGAGREAFPADGRERALAPDALIHLRDDSGRGLLGFVELDLGTMSHARLKTKAAGYASYAAQAAWTERHPFCPCLLFLTTTEARGLAFLKTLLSLLDRQGRGNYYGRRRGYLDWFAAAACAHGREPERALAEACWDDIALAGGGLTLTDCLNKARAAYDATRAKQEAEQRSRDAEREQLRSNPEARRGYLQQNHLRIPGGHLDQFGASGTTALYLLLHSSEPMSDLEREAFAALVRQLAADPLDPEPAAEPVPTTSTDVEAVAQLVGVYRARQRARINSLRERYGEGPVLRRHRQDLAAGGLLGPRSCETLDQHAHRDQQARHEQERLRRAYLARREREARQRKREVGLAARLAHGHTAAYTIVDHDRLRVCRRCDEIAYPPGDERLAGGSYQERPQASRCHFCGGSDLGAWDPAFQSELEYGPDTRLRGSDLTLAGIDGSMDDHGNREGSGL